MDSCIDLYNTLETSKTLEFEVPINEKSEELTPDEPIFEPSMEEDSDDKEYLPFC